MIHTLTLNATVDRVLRAPGFAAGGVRRAELAALVAAGKGFNVSRVLAELGAPSVAAGLVGRTEREFYAGSFLALGVETVLADFPAPTRSNVTVLDPDSGAETHLRERGPEAPEAALAEIEELLLPRLAGGDALVFCGSLPRGLAPERPLRLLAEARARGARLFMDTSGPALAAARELRPDVLSLNEEELAELGVAAPGRGTGGLAEAVRAALRLPLVLVKLGAAGAVAVSPAEAWRAAPPAVEARNTVGAGDAFNAGYLARESAGLPEALRLAVACGAAQAACGRLGALRRADAERLAGQVTLERL